ncbi:MAG TPA: glycosyltransferase [Bryobacteraceae bacterium]|nr:glycosyltransferase [Bryobacteraceae bacterium]
MRIVFTTFGSLGDLHPYLAIAIEMKRRGYDAVIASTNLYREKVESEGIQFASVRPDLENFGDRSEMVAKVMHAHRGPEFLFREMLMPALRDSLEDVMAAAEGADLLVSHIAMFATPIVAELLKKRWISIALQPAIFFSATDPPYFPQFGSLPRLSPVIARAIFCMLRGITARWLRPVQVIRRELGLLPSRSPVFGDQFSPWGTLACFSPLLAAPQPDWPANVTVTGFAIYDKLNADAGGLAPEIEGFLNAGEPPVIFTLGSSAVFDPRTFYENSAAAVRRLGRRAILLAGLDYETRIGIRSDEQILIAEYAPYSQLFPRGAATAHSGGAGTTAQAMLSGRPTLVMPYSHDQPDNGMRIMRLGMGDMISRRKYTVDEVAGRLQRLLSDASLQTRAREVGERVRTERGAAAAADALEKCLQMR